MDLAGTPNPLHLPPQPTQKKAVVKCEECRRKKIKCFPEWRDWSHGEQCTPCIKSNLPCGPNVRKQADAQSPAPPVYAPSPATNPASSFRMPTFQQDLSPDELNPWFPTPYPSFGAGSPSASSPPFVDMPPTSSWTSVRLDKAHSE